MENVTTDTTGAPTSAMNPKVAASAITGIVLVVVVAVLSAVTPTMLETLGPWGVLIYSGIVALGSALAGYIKRPGDIR